MKLPLAAACSFSLVASTLMSQPSLAQGVCYLVNDSGQTINLDELCQSDSATPTAPAAPASEPTDAASADGEPAAPTVTTTTITVTGNSVNRLDNEATPSAADAAEADTAAPTRPQTTFISGPGQPVGGGAVMTNSDPRLILTPPVTEPVAEPVLESSPAEPPPATTP